MMQAVFKHLCFQVNLLPLLLLGGLLLLGLPLLLALVPGDDILLKKSEVYLHPRNVSGCSYPGNICSMSSLIIPLEYIS